MPYRWVTKQREVTQYRDVIKQDRLGYTEIQVHRPKIIYFEFEGMRPNMPHWIFFGDEEVTKYCNTSYTLSDYTGAARDSDIKEPGDKYVNATAFPTALGGPSNGGGSNSLTSGSDGSLRGFFYLQSNATTNFSTKVDGTSFSALDISVMDRDNSLSYASTKFYGVGQYEDWFQYTVQETQTITESYKEKEYYDAPQNNGGNDDGGITVTYNRATGTTTINFGNGITHVHGPKKSLDNPYV
jgi:hypothetical protein